MHKVIEQKQLEEFKGCNKKILIHFITEWCSPCRLSKKLLESEITQASPYVILVEVNCDEADDLVLKYKIEGVPTLVLLNKSMNINQKLIGYLPDKIKLLFKKIKTT